MPNGAWVHNDQVSDSVEGRLRYYILLYQLEGGAIWPIGDDLLCIRWTDAWESVECFAGGVDIELLGSSTSPAFTGVSGL
jgi:hypothetical protein